MRKGFRIAEEERAGGEAALAECPDAGWSWEMVWRPPYRQAVSAPMPLLVTASWWLPDTWEDFPPTANTTSHSDYPAAIYIRRPGLIPGHLPRGESSHLEKFQGTGIHQETEDGRGLLADLWKKAFALEEAECRTTEICLLVTPWSHLQQKEQWPLSLYLPALKSGHTICHMNWLIIR